MTEQPDWNFTCDRECAEAYQYRTYDIMSYASFGGIPCECTIDDTSYTVLSPNDYHCVDTRNCSSDIDSTYQDFCFGDCEYSWSTWSECTSASGQQCGNGTQSRDYYVIKNSDPEICTDITNEARNCSVLCPIPANVNVNGSFIFGFDAEITLDCSDADSRIAIMDKIITYLGFDLDDADGRFAGCTGDEIDESPPAWPPSEGGCPLIIGFGDTTNWDSPNCVTPSDNQIFVQYSLRLPDAPCDCPINCTSAWTEWSDCPNCHNPEDSRKRSWFVVTPAENGGEECQEPLETTQENVENGIYYPDAECRTDACCAGEWTQWSDCDVTCDTGTVYRYFNIDVSAADNADLDCSQETQNKTCLYVKNDYYYASQILSLDGASDSTLTTTDLRQSCEQVSDYLDNDYVLTDDIKNDVCYRYMAQIAAWTIGDDDCYGRTDKAECVHIV